ncbi:MAG: DNA cytosine methyltransferase [Deltaproteobacteria bacterium]|nr:DNA cytosine methyltransferase [Deltaproteobacteria bacterium]
MRFSVLHLFCGLGGGALGFQRARANHAGLVGSFRTLCGIDLDAAACRDFKRLTKSPAVRADVACMQPAELLVATRGEHPDVIFTSPPCTGFSGLLSNEKSGSEHYQALNRLVLQGLFLSLETFVTKPPKLILLENVPRIAQRGEKLLLQVRSLLARYGYVFHEGFHDCGELGGLAQHRRRFLLIARHVRSVPTFVYSPPKQRVRSISEVLGNLPRPELPSAGPMHRLPRLKWKTWVRLALIPAGGDWRALGTRDGSKRHNNVLRVVPWNAPSVAVTAGGHPTSGGPCCADPRFDGEYRRGTYRVVRWDGVAGTVTGEAAPSTGPFSVADPRMGQHENKMRVERWEAPAHTVTGSDRVGSGAPSVADPRIAGKGSRPDLFGVLAWNQAAKTINGQARVSSSNCPAAVADPRLPNWEDRPDPPPLIIGEDGTWHRPLTTLELAALQGLPTEVDGQPLVLDGASHSGWRKRIGNCVPPPAAQAMAEAILDSLMASSAGQTFRLGGSGIWVQEGIHV